MSDGLNIDDLQPRELLSLLNLNAPVSRGVILQRTAEMTAAAAGDPQTVKMIAAAGDKLWLAVEALWEIGVSGRARPAQLESLISLGTWMGKINRHRQIR